MYLYVNANGSAVICPAACGYLNAPRTPGSELGGAPR